MTTTHIAVYEEEGADIKTYRHTDIELMYRRSMKTHTAVCRIRGGRSGYKETSLSISGP
jgi:hypothetical protein